MAQTTLAPLPHHGRPVSRRVLWGAATLLVIVVVLQVTGVLAQAWRLLPGQGQTTPTYQTATVARTNLSTSVTATGPVAAVSNLPLTFKSSGKLASIDVAVGDHITKGQKLATLDTTDLQLSLDQAKANLAQAQANLDKVQSGATTEQKNVAQTSVDSAKQSATDAQAGIDTAKQSAAKSVAVSTSNVQSAATSLASAKAALASAQDQQAKQLASDQAAIVIAQKNLDGVKASVDANLPILLNQIQSAKNSLWATQINRDSVCGHGGGAACDAANANVASAETSLNSAQAQLVQGQKQGAQQIAQAQASLEQAQLQLKNDQAKLNASVISAQNQVKQSEAALATSQASLAQAQTSATASVQNAQSQANQAQSQVKSAEASYAQTVSPPSQSDLETAKAQVTNAEAAVEQAQNNVNAATMVAPFAGTVVAVNGTVGQWITGGPVNANASVSPSALITLIDLDNLQVTAQVNEADIAKVKVGDPVSFTVSAFPTKTFTGQVEQVQPVGTTTQNVVNYSVTSSIKSMQDAALYPGMTATVNVITAERQNAIVVPNAALSFGQTAVRNGLVSVASGSSRQPSQATPATPVSRQPSATSSGSRGVVVAREGGQLKAMPVTLGISDGTMTEILSGLNGGEVIVTGQAGGTSSSGSSAGTRSTGGGSPFGGGLR